MRIFIVGPMASGKSTLGKRLAQKLNLDFIDTDKEIEKKAGAEISWIFEVEGEEGFRERESSSLKESIEMENVVISTGGGIIIKKLNRSLMTKKGKVVYLNIPLSLQIKRTSKDKKRPLLTTGDKEETLRSLMKIRSPLYEEVADITIDLQKQKNRKQIINEIIEKL